jgi:uncharacterized coiled-coil protein SlyX
MCAKIAGIRGEIGYVQAMQEREGPIEGVVSRVVDLEERFMRLEKYAHELSGVVAAQQRTIDALADEARRLRERVLDEGDAVGPQERPPHY